MYFAGLNKGKASMEGLKNAQNVAKTSTIGLTIAQTALNMAISMGLMVAISLAIKGFDKLVNSAKRASEAADEAFSETNDKVQEYDNELKSLDELIAKYKELKESGNLDLEGRKEIKEIQNDIADLVGTQAKNLDLVNGKLDDEIKKLDEISAKEAKRAYETATANYNNSQKANESATGDDSFLFVDGYAYTGKREKEAENILKEAGFGGNVQSGGFFGNTLFVMDSLDNDMKELKGAQEKADYLQSMIDVLEQNGQRATDLYSGLIRQRDDYLKYIDNQQSAANSLVNSWITYSQFSNEELSKINIDSVDSFEQYRQKMIDEAKNDESIGKMLADGTLSEEDLENSVNDFMATATQFSTWYEQWIGNVQGSTLNENDIFSIGDYKDQIDNIQSSISTLRDALDSLNSGTLDEESVLDLMQEFPDLIPYIDLAADGFGNLSEGLSTLIEQQPESLINSLETLKNSLNTEEERAQVDELINSLQLLSSYGDTGMDAYATSIGATWNDTANVIEGVTTQFENLAKVQEAVSNGLTMSATAAAELAKMYPEILSQAEFSADGQITLNEDVVKNILAGDQSIINSQIEKLEADKAELTAKKELAIAELEIANQVGTAKGQITEDELKLQIEAMNQELENEVEKDNQVAEAYAQTAETIAQNAENLDDYVGNVAVDMAQNMVNAAISMANTMKVNSENSQSSLSGLAKKASDVALAIANAAKGIQTGDTDTIYIGTGGTNSTGITKVKNAGSFTSTVNDYINGILSLDSFKENLSVDISNYENAISNIDSQIEILKNLQSTFEDTVNSANGGIGGHDYVDRIKELENEKDKINSALNDANSSASSTEDEYEELFDFFERRVSVLSDALSLLESNLENVTGSFAKNQLLDAEININAEKINNYTDALAMYTEKANEALSKLPSDIAEKIKNGAVAITDFVGDGNEEVVEAIEDYENWTDKIADCQQELAELKTTIRQLELDKFNNIIEEFTNQFDIRDDANSLIEKQIALLEEAGELIGESFYTAQIDQAQKQLSILEEEKTKLIEQMTTSLSSGRIQQGTDEWLEMVDALSDVDSSILDCKTSIEEFDNAILELHAEIFDRIQEQFSDLNSELGNLGDLFDDFDVSDDKGNWSKEGLAQLGLLDQQYELAQYQIQQYSKEITELNAQYSAGKYSATEYADRLAELTSAQWDAVNSSESVKDAIMDLNEARIDAEIEGIEKEIDAYKELIDAQIDALQTSKDLHDYEESIAEKTKSISDLERQIAAMTNDNTAAATAKRKLLEEQLAEAKADLEEAEYEHSIEVQENALNEQYDNFEKEKNNEIEALGVSLEDIENIIAQSFESVKGNADVIGQEIAAIAAQHGITVSDALISSWQSGENAIASYGLVLSESSSAFIGNIMGVENEVWNLQAQADSTANSLSWMFSTRADALVNELVSSYYSEVNLNAMTNALQNSLINTLERGYDISGITSALSSIANAANNVASAANNATAALANMGAASTTSSTPSSPSTTSSNRLVYNSVDSSTGETLYKDTSTGMIETVDYWKKYGGKYGISSAELSKLTKYASGTRSAKGGLSIKDEEGYELTLPKLANGNYTITGEGDQILTKVQTDNLFDWSKFNPDNLIPVDIASSLDNFKLPDIAKRDIGSQTLTIGNLVTVEGNIDDTNIKRLEKVAENAVNKAFRQFSDGIRK